MVTLLENFEDAKRNGKIQISGDFRRPKFQIFPRGACPQTPLADLHLGTGAILTLLHHAKFFTVSVSVSPPDKVLHLTSRSPASMTLNHVPPHFIMFPMSLDVSDGANDDYGEKSVASYIDDHIDGVGDCDDYTLLMLLMVMMLIVIVNIIVVIYQL